MRWLFESLAVSGSIKTVPVSMTGGGGIGGGGGENLDWTFSVTSCVRYIQTPRFEQQRNRTFAMSLLKGSS